MTVKCAVCGVEIRPDRGATCGTCGAPVVWRHRAIDTERAPENGTAEEPEADILGNAESPSDQGTDYPQRVDP